MRLMLLNLIWREVSFMNKIYDKLLKVRPYMFWRVYFSIMGCSFIAFLIAILLIIRR